MFVSPSYVPPITFPAGILVFSHLFILKLSNMVQSTELIVADTARYCDSERAAAPPSIELPVAQAQKSL